MKPGRAFSLLTGVALLGAIAKFNEMPRDAQPSLLSDAAETARTAAQSLLSSALATYNEVTGSTAQPPVRVRVAGHGTDGENAAPRRVVEPAEPPSGNPLWALPLKQLSSTQERPIFTPSRRLPPPTPTFVAPVAVRQPVKPSEPERPTVALVGTIIGTGDDRMGVFLDTSTKGILSLRIGEDYRGWVVRLIQPREATLMKDGEPAVVLELPRPGTASSPMRGGPDAMLDLIWKVGAE